MTDKALREKILFLWYHGLKISEIMYVLDVKLDEVKKAIREKDLAFEKRGCQKIQEIEPVQLREEHLTVREVWDSIPEKIQNDICLFLGGGPLKVGSLEQLTEIQWRVVSFFLTESIRKKWGDLDE